MSASELEMPSVTFINSILSGCVGRGPEGSSGSEKRMRKGQVTVFIIIGIVLLLAVGVTVYLRQSSADSGGRGGLPVLSDIPVAARPARLAVQQCVEQLGEEAFRLIGDHGGYLSTEMIRPRLVPAAPTESDAVAFSPGSELAIPYWYQMRSANTCTSCEFAARRPFLRKSEGKPSIEGQVDSYINERIGDCVKNAPLAEYSLTPLAAPETDTMITPAGVHIFVKYPVLAARGTDQFKIPDHVADIPLNIAEIYDLAVEITNLEIQHRYLEKSTKNLLATFGRLDKGSLPPFTGVELGLGSSRYWVKQDVEEKVKSMLSAYVPVMQVWGTANYGYISAPAGTGDPELFEMTYNRQHLIPVKSAHPSISATFSYLDWWKPFFDLNCKGQICGPDTFTNTFGFSFGMQKYNFAYDISYPVLVELQNPRVFGGRSGGYSFKFMLEANLRNNKPLQTDNKPITGIAVPETGSLLCEVGQRNSAPVRIKIMDGRTKKPVDAAVTFSCGTESCSIGNTIDGELNTPLPVCFGGSLSATLAEYLPTSTSLSTSLDEEKEVRLTLEPIRKINIAVSRRMLKKGLEGWILDPEPTPHGTNDQSIISLSRQTNPFEEQFTSLGEVLGDKFSKEVDYSKGVPLVPGTYGVSITTVSRDTLIIPKARRCYGSDGLFGKKECVDIPSEPVTFGTDSPFPAGGARFNWTITAEQLDKAKEIEFFTLYLAEEQIPEAQRQIEDLEETSKINEYSSQYRSYLTPVLR